MDRMRRHGLYVKVLGSNGSVGASNSNAKDNILGKEAIAIKLPLLEDVLAQPRYHDEPQDPLVIRGSTRCQHFWGSSMCNSSTPLGGDTRRMLGNQTWSRRFETHHVGITKGPLRDVLAGRAEENAR